MKNSLTIILVFISLSVFGQASTVTYENKDKNLPLSDPRRNFTAENANELKAVINTNATLLNLKAPSASPTFTGTVSGVTKSMVGLGNVDNTSDADKPVSTAHLTALNLKANLASPTFTGTVGGITKSMVGLGSVDNTTDASKPVSTAQQTALDLKANLSSPNFSGTPSLPTGTTATTQTNGDNSTKLATTAYADAKVANAITNGVTTSSPNQDQIFDALALKVAVANVVVNEVPSGTINGSNGTFTLAFTPVKLMLYVDGLALTPIVDYTISGTTLTIGIAPSSAILAHYIR